LPTINVYTHQNIKWIQRNCQASEKMARALVSITISVDPDLIQQINDDVEGKSQSARIRKCLEKGYEAIKNGE
jgi:hypothetical protein